MICAVALTDPGTGAFLRAALRRSGLDAQLVDAESAADALAALAAHPGSFVVMSIASLDEAVAPLAVITSSRPDAVIVGLSGMRTRAEVERLLVLGVDEVMGRGDLSPDRLAVAFLAAAQRVSRTRPRDEAPAANDRRRIARDLHDHVIGRLFAIGMELEYLSGRQPGPEDLNRLAAGIDDTIGELRYAVEELRHGARPDLFEHAARGVVDEIRHATRRRVTVRFDPVGDEPEGDLARSALAVLREMLTNALKHGVGPIEAVVGVGDELCVCVRSRRDGPGPVGGHGMRSMHERAEALGGRLDVHVDGDDGIEVTWRVPATLVLHRV